jgi:hypothetical protein
MFGGSVDIADKRPCENTLSIHSLSPFVRCPLRRRALRCTRHREQGIDLLCENTRVSLMAVRDIGDTTYTADRRRPEYTPHFGQIRIRKRHF